MEQPRGPLLRTGRLPRVALSLLLLIAAGVLFYVDHTRYVGLYSVAHAAMRWASLWSIMFALALVLDWLRLPSPGRVAGLVLLGLACVPVLLLTPQRPVALYAMGQRPWSRDLLQVAQRLLDVDGDGYAAWLAGGDCDNFNASVHPGAREIPGNGLDDNCVLGDGKRRGAAQERVPRAKQPSPTDVVLITVDALRPDHIGAYNAAYGPAGRNTTPNLDAWARDAVVFRNAFTPGAWTIISLAAVMRGIYARRLQWDGFYETSNFRLLPATTTPVLQAGESLWHFFPIPANDQHPTLAGLLKRRGMRTIAIVDDGFSAMLQPGNGLNRGFEKYYYPATASDSPDPESVRRVRRALAGMGSTTRYFLWVHLFGLHYPNEAHAEVPSYGPSMADGYDHELRFADLQLKELFALFEARNPKPIVIVTGDHGETIAPWMRSHGFGLDEDTMRVPLLIKAPGVPARSVDATVNLVDLFPTVMAWTKTPAPKLLDGIDLAPLMAGHKGDAQRFVLTDCWRFAPDRKPYLDAVGATDGKRVVFFERSTGLVSFPGVAGGRGYALPAAAASADPLARFALGYTEESDSAP